jgi:S1-C subfamily serine protease
MDDPASSSVVEDLSRSLAALVSGVSNSVVAVRSHRSRSSGFVWRPGLVVTADEALSDEGDVTATAEGGQTFSARVLGRDPTTDIALLRIDSANLPPAALATTAAAPGEIAVVVGAEDGAPTAALGIVGHASGPWRSLRGGDIDARLELAITLRPRSEGGLALDAGGHGFGMAVFGPRRRVLVIPSATIERVAAKLEQHGRISRGYLGLGLQQVTLQDGDGIGIMVMRVDPHGPAAAAGVRQGDIIVTLDREPVRGVRSLLRALGPSSVGRTLALGLTRAGDPTTVSLTVVERPPA